ncbi:MAG: dihydrolipoamide acetyltransferase, partial [Woeseia sp.]|nr:dihydrolipoamide acetyltransferase [Woeseia sp.]
MSDSTDIIIPDLGDFEDVEVIEVLVASGDTVAKEDGLITLETDKATMDVPAPADGVIDTITVSVGDRVNNGDKIGTMKGGDVAASDGDAAAASEAAKEPEKDAGDDTITEAAPIRDHAAQSGATAGGGAQTVNVPDIGDFNNVDVIEVLVEV